MSTCAVRSLRPAFALLATSAIASAAIAACGENPNTRSREEPVGAPDHSTPGPDQMVTFDPRAMWPESVQMLGLFDGTDGLCGRTSLGTYCWTLSRSETADYLVEAHPPRSSDPYSMGGRSVTITDDGRFLDVVVSGGHRRYEIDQPMSISPSATVKNFGVWTGPFAVLDHDALWTLSTADRVHPFEPKLYWFSMRLPEGLDVLGARFMDERALLTRTGEVWLWGENRAGRVDPTSQDEVISAPRRVPLPGPATDFAMMTRESCAIVANEVYCWGRRRSPEVPTPPGWTPEATVPTQIGGMPEGPKRFPDPRSPCVIADNREVTCWNRRGRTRRFGEDVEYFARRLGWYCAWGRRALSCMEADHWERRETTSHGVAHLLAPGVSIERGDD